MRPPVEQIRQGREVSCKYEQSEQVPDLSGKPPLPGAVCHNLLAAKGLCQRSPDHSGYVLRFRRPYRPVSCAISSPPKDVFGFKASVPMPPFIDQRHDVISARICGDSV